MDAHVTVQDNKAPDAQNDKSPEAQNDKSPDAQVSYKILANRDQHVRLELEKNYLGYCCSSWSNTLELESRANRAVATYISWDTLKLSSSCYSCSIFGYFGPLSQYH